MRRRDWEGLLAARAKALTVVAGLGLGVFVGWLLVDVLLPAFGFRLRW